ncbi:protoporphyrinogen oxidase [Xylanibacillus composti]|uniref:Coproporphyrinogen III oxidase n=1 Tax=Xylanibacillus composti TaxID=1572762 RepID=A0A8J4M3K1_9BACL|nr:protoporphyrinogen oxidase [Xylanibacillus composti]GIQ70190.1 protoporphyrinogen oxidase [Xylanibacillus composti]
MERATSKKIVIAGAGITGLSAAYYLLEALGKQDRHAEILILDKADRPGGKIRTLRRDDFVIERGPDSFLSRKLPIIELTRSLGIEDELVPMNPKAQKTYILHHKRLHSMPPGLVLGIPTKMSPFLKTGLVSPSGKLRAAMDLLLPRRQGDGDESLGDFLERRLGKEVHEHIAEPLLAGIYAGDTRSLSVKATFPQFHHIERTYRSLILGMAQSRKQTQASMELPPIAKQSMFLNYRNGLGFLIESLVEHLKDKAEFRYGTSVESLDRVKDAEGRQQYLLGLNNGESLTADAVIMAMPAYETAGILKRVAEIQALQSIRYVSVANVILAYDRPEAKLKMDGSGFLVPRKEGRFITACTWTSSKWLHAAPQGKLLLRCYVGRAGEDAWQHMSDEEIVAGVRRELSELLDFDLAPLFVDVNRWMKAMPQYPVGHLEQMKKAEHALAEQLPGVVLAGSAYYGVGIPDCIQSGRAAAGKLAALWSES